MDIVSTQDHKILDGIIGIEETIKLQKQKLDSLRKKVRTLQFKTIDIAGDYTSVTYKAIDGGKMKVSLNPFEINVIDVADSNFITKLNFVIPEIKSYDDDSIDDQAIDAIIAKLDELTIIKKFTTTLGIKSIKDVTSIPLTDSSNIMQIAEWACIFERVMLDLNEPTIILKDGLLRTKSIKDTLIANLRKKLEEKKKYVKLVGVSKTSKLVSLLSAAIHLEKKIPQDAIGYIKIPLDLELQAYNWTGHGRPDKEKIEPLDYAFGELYVAKLAKASNLLVTIEFPKDLSNGKDVYSETEITEIISFLAKDSKFSYPVIGYPQTIMRAHEAAARLGFAASIIKDEIKEKIMENIDEGTGEFIRDGWLITDFVDKGVLGGGKYD